MSIFNAPRALTVKSAAIPQGAFGPMLVPLKLEGYEGINSLFEYRLTLQTPDSLQFLGDEGSNLDLPSFVGCEITCFIELEGHGQFVAGQRGASGMGQAANQGAGVREISALITKAEHIGTENRHDLYALTLRPWAWLAMLTVDSKTFQDKTPIQVIEEVLSDYSYSNIKITGESYPVIDYITQFNEPDWVFVTRIMQEWGINFHFQHDSGVHRLVWSDHNGAFQATQKDSKAGSAGGPSAYHTIPYYASPSHKIDQEYIHEFRVIDSLTSGSFHAVEWDYTNPKDPMAVEARDPRPTGQAKQDVFLWHGDLINDGTNPGGDDPILANGSSITGIDYNQPNKGSDKAANKTLPQGKHLARLRMQALRQTGLRARGAGHIRGIVPGCTFELVQHSKKSANGEYIVLYTRFLIENVGEDTRRSGSAASGVQALGALSDAQRLTGRWRVHVEFEVQPTKEALRPAATRRKPVIPGYQIALVVGPADGVASNNIWTDHLGRIKVSFIWRRGDKRDISSSCWVRVAHNWAGNQLGGIHLPRVGQEAIITFESGDPDQPLCVGTVRNAMNLPNWKLPGQHAISGFRSRELVPGGGNAAAGRSNVLAMDDTEGQIQVQVQSEHLYSGISMGYITRISGHAGRADTRGEGLEARTDGHLAIRSKKGMLIDTHGRIEAKGHITDMGETIEQLGHAQDQHAVQADLASQHNAQEQKEQDEVAKALEKQNQEIKGQGTADAQSGSFPEFAQPHIVQSSPAGNHTTTLRSTHHHSGEHHAITAAGHTSISAGKSLLASVQGGINLFAYKLKIMLVAASEHIEIRALKAGINLMAKTAITHLANTLSFKARQETEIVGGSSRIVVNSSGIFFYTGGEFKAHAASVSFDGAQAGAAPPLPSPPQPGVGQLELLHQYASKAGVATADFKVIDSLGQKVTGKLDASGFAVANGLAPGPVKVLFSPDPRNPWDAGSLIGKSDIWPPH